MGRKITVDEEVFGMFHDVLYEMLSSLTAIRGFSSFYKYPKIELTADMLETIHRNANRCAELRQLMSDYTVLETRGLNIYPSEFDVVMLIKEMVAKHITDSFNLTIESDTSISIWHDKGEISYIIDNLIGCIDESHYHYSKKKTAVVVTFGYVDDKKWFLRLTRTKPEKGYATILAKYANFFITRKKIELLGGMMEMDNDTDNRPYCLVILPVRYEAPTSENVD